jgi:4-hydroxy-tetrahydrodipicolinate synthase
MCADISRRKFLQIIGTTAVTALPIACATRKSTSIATVAPVLTPPGRDISLSYGIVPPLVTPLTESKAVDYPAFERLVDWHVAQGVTGIFVVCGSGEMFRLTDDEAVKLTQIAVKRSGKARVFAGGTIHRSVEEVDENITLLKRLAETGADGLFVTPPMKGLRRSTPREKIDEIVLDWFRKLHDGTDAKLLAYEAPGGGIWYNFSPESLSTLASMERYVGIKETHTRSDQPASEALKPIRDKITAADGRLGIMQANGRYLVESLQAGCTGGIPIAANVAPGLYMKVYELTQRGEIEEAKILQMQLSVVLDLLERRYIASAKYALDLLGVPMTIVMRGRQRRELDRGDMIPLRDMVGLVKKLNAEYGITTT